MTGSGSGGNPIRNKKIVLGVTGGIAAYKAADLASFLTQAGARVQAILTRSAREFITPLTFGALTGQPVAGEMFDGAADPLAHIALAEGADVFLIAPATANTIGRLAAGLADDLLAATALVVTCPRLLAPAMNADMFAKAEVQENLATLCRRGWRVIPPAAGRLACGAVGPGRLAERETIAAYLRRALSRPDLAGLNVLVTAGGTREPVDPVRYLGNRSSGKMGYALAAAAWERGAAVTLVSGPASLPVPTGVELRSAGTAAEMQAAVLAAFPDTDIVVMAAAVADFRPARPAAAKIKKGGQAGLTLDLEPTPDILASLGQAKEKQVLVGFAAETEDLLANASRKLAAKNLDLIVANDVSRPGAGMESDANAATLLRPDGSRQELLLMDKQDLAHAIWDAVCALLRVDNLLHGRGVN